MENKDQISHSENENLHGLNESVDTSLATDSIDETAAIIDLHEEEHFDHSSLDEIYERLHNVMNGSDDDVKKFRKSYVNARKRYKDIFEEEKRKVFDAFVESGEKAEDFKYSATPISLKVKDILNKYQERLTEMRRKEEATLQQNFLVKQDIVNELKDLISNESDMKKAFERFNALKEKWSNTGHVSAQHNNELWQNYKFFTDKFYEFVQINKGLYEVELTKNEGIKEGLIAKVEALLEETSIQKSIENLHHYQKVWRETGPVHRDKSDEMWNRFKLAVDKVYGHRDEFLKEREEKRNSNLTLKQELCAKLESLSKEEFSTLNSWKDKEVELKTIEEDWKGVGRVPQKENDAIWERFKAAKKEFLKKKYDLLKHIKEDLNKNLDAKIKLCEEAEALQTSTDWKGTTLKLIKLQNDWKKTGSVERKKSDEVWNRFRAACDAFFHAKEAHFAGQTDREKENLETKKSVLQKVIDYTPVESFEENMAFVKSSRGEYNSVGHVPMSEKANIDKAFDEAILDILGKLNVDKDKRHKVEYKLKLEQFLESNNAEKQLKEERTFVGNKVRKIEEEISQIENNLGFFAKGADSLKKEYEDKIAKLKLDLQHWEDKKLQLKSAFKLLEEKAKV